DPMLFDRPGPTPLEVAETEIKDPHARASLVLVTDKLVDWITSNRRLECAYVRTTDDSLDVTLPDGTKASFTRSDTAWMDVVRQTSYVTRSWKRRDRCMKNLTELAGLFSLLRRDDPVRTMKHCGAAWFCDIALRGLIRRGEEKVLFCPDDPT